MLRKQGFLSKIRHGGLRGPNLRKFWTLNLCIRSQITNNPIWRSMESYLSNRFRAVLGLCCENGYFCAKSDMEDYRDQTWETFEHETCVLRANKEITRFVVPWKVTYRRFFVQSQVHAAKTGISEQNPTWRITGTKLEKILNMKLVY